MRVFVVGTGSSGNCTVLESDCGARLFLDAGISPTRVATRLRELGVEIFSVERAGKFGDARGVVGVVVTHHHGDHFAQLLPLARALRVPVFVHQGVDMRLVRSSRARVDVREYVPGEPLHVGPFVVEALPVPHDAPQVALRVGADGRRFAMATDLGHVKKDLERFLGDADLALVEANHCPRLLDAGPYPPRLRERVRGPLGHLSNEQTGDLAHRLQWRRLARLVLGHVSRVNNDPARALDVVASRAKDLPVELLPQGMARAFDVVPRPMRVGLDQLALPFGALPT